METESLELSLRGKKNYFPSLIVGTKSSCMILTMDKFGVNAQLHIKLIIPDFLPGKDCLVYLFNFKRLNL